MKDKTKFWLFRKGSIIFWFLLHFIVIPGIVFFVWTPWTVSLPWVTLVAVFATPFYIMLVHWLDDKLDLRGIISIVKDLQKRAEAAPKPEVQQHAVRSASPPPEAVTITTGFSATIMFFASRFYHDLAHTSYTGNDYKMFVLTAMILLLSFACISNLLQIILQKLLARPIWPNDHRLVLRSPLKILRFFSWHFLLTSVILISSLIANQVFCLVINFLYGMSLYFYYFSLSHLPRPPMQSSAKDPDAPKEHPEKVIERQLT